MRSTRMAKPPNSLELAAIASRDAAVTQSIMRRIYRHLAVDLHQVSASRSPNYDPFDDARVWLGSAVRSLPEVFIVRLICSELLICSSEQDAVTALWDLADVCNNLTITIGSMVSLDEFIDDRLALEISADRRRAVGPVAVRRNDSSDTETERYEAVFRGFGRPQAESHVIAASVSELSASCNSAWESLTGLLAARSRAFRFALTAGFVADLIHVYSCAFRHQCLCTLWTFARNPQLALVATADRTPTALKYLA